MVKEAAIKTVYIFIILFTAFGLFAENTRPPARQINSNPVNVVAVGYDIENNTKAQQMLNDMAQAAQESGAAGRVILAGRDEAELDNAMEQAISIATGAGACRLEIKTPSVSPGERIMSSLDLIEDKTAWISFENETIVTGLYFIRVSRQPERPNIRRYSVKSGKNITSDYLKPGITSARRKAPSRNKINSSESFCIRVGVSRWPKT